MRKIVGQTFFLLILEIVLAPVTSAQYTITTIAGGGPQNGVTSTSVALSYANGIAVDPAGNVYIAAQQRNRVYKAGIDGTLTTVAGTGTPGFSGDTGPATSAQLSLPTSVAVDSTGNLYIGDTGNARIRKVSNGNIATVAGNGSFGFSGDTGPAISAQLGGGSLGLAVDRNGVLYIADSNNNRIRKVEGGVITTVAGNGISGYSGDTGLATGAQLNFPWGVAVDRDFNLFIGDGNNYRVRKVSVGIITTVAGNGTFGYSGDTGPATAAQLTYTTGVAVDGAGNLYIADTSVGRIRLVTGTTISTVAGGGGGCGQQTDPVGDGCPAVNGILNGPYGVGLDGAGNLYIADSNNYRVRKVANGAISTVAGNGTLAYSGDNGLAANAQFLPQGVAVRSPGNFYIADGPDVRIRQVAGGLITTAAGNGVCCYNGENIPATSAQMNNPNGVAADSTGIFYTIEGQRVRKVSGGLIDTFAGNGQFGYSGDGGPATSAQLSIARGAAVDANGNVYIADQGNNRVRKVAGTTITTVAGGGTLDGATATGVSLRYAVGVAVDSAGNIYVPSSGDNRVYKVSTNGVITTVAGNGSTGFSGDNGLATAAQLNTPYGVAVNAAGTVVYIADRGNNRVRMVTGGTISTVAGGGPGCPQQTDAVGDGCPGTSALLNAPAVVALDSSGTNLYIADALHYRIRKLTGGVIATVAGSGAIGYSGDNGPATSAALNYATGIAVDPTNGDLYIGDSESFRVRKVSGTTITTVAGTGAYGYSGDNGPATSARLSYCYGVAVDSSGNLFIADAANHRIRMVSGTTITTVAGTGAGGYSGDGGLATSAQINDPYGVAVDGAGNLYIADTNNYVIRKVSGANISTVAGNGFASFSGDGGQATGAQLDGPTAVAVDGSGNLYISDGGNLRIRQVSANGTITTLAGNGACCYSGDGGPATSASIGYLQGIAADSMGNVYLADSSSNRIRRVSGSMIATIAGNGGYGYSGDGGNATDATLSNPQGVAVDSAGNIYIADTGNFAIRLLTTSLRSITSITPPSATAGTPSFTLTVNGSGFVNGDIVQWNGAALTTTFVNSGQLTAQVDSSLIAQIGLAAVTVNGLSNAGAFTIFPQPALTIAKTHTGNLTQGQTGATYTLTVSNATGAGSTSGLVTVTEAVPFGLTLVSMAGAGWTCPGTAANNCTRGNALAGGASYPAITVTVNVAANASSLLINQVSVAGGGSAGGNASDAATVATAGALRFVPITPCRVADTRKTNLGAFGAPSLAGGVSRDFVIPNSACAVPATARAYSFNVAVVPAGPLGFLTLYPAGQTRPVVSTLNSLDGRIKSNAAIVAAATGGAVSVFASNATDVVLDINGYFVPAADATALAFYPTTPCRIVDTRKTATPLAGPSLVGGQSRTFPMQSSSSCNLPAAAQAYSLNLAAVPNGALGFVTAYPTGQTRPVAANLNDPTGTVTANAAIVPAGANGSIDVYASNNTDLVIDVNGYFAPIGTGGMSLYGVTPCRVLDTRKPAGSQPITSLDVAVSGAACGIPAAAQAYVLSVAVVPPVPLGFLTLWAQGQTRPVVSTLNALDGAITSNMAIVPTTNGSISAFPSNPTHLVLDIVGYFGQ